MKNTVSAVARKELRTYFLSPIALIFIAVFLLASLFSFFWVEGFFARNTADIRPLFEWLPVLLIFLVPALGMRLWSDEERTGTLETLRTLPLQIHAMVLGKFLGGLALVTVALVLTLPVPITVELLGNLDWGPVWGGYLATLLLAGAYLAITLWASALTSNQILALILGALSCGTLYLIGSDAVAGFFGNDASERLRAVGAGSRFDSIQRGVIDFRDLVYYGSIIAFFLALNTIGLDSRRWVNPVRAAKSRFSSSAAVAVVLGVAFAALIRSDSEGTMLLVEVAAAAVGAGLVVGIMLFLQSKTPNAGAQRLPPLGAAVATRRNTVTVFLLLMGLNLVAINVVVHPLRGLRMDLTERNEYSISNVTKELLRGVDEPLLIRGYFSAKTHPLLAPLVPRIRDVIEEYGAIGGSEVRAEFLDPTEDEELEKEAQQNYGVRSVPFQFKGRHEAGVVNSYFHILIRYGDQYEVLEFTDLIEVQAGTSDVEVSLRNLEYDLTRSVQKVVYGFQSLESVFARLPKDAKLTAIISKEGIPDSFSEVPGRIDAVVEELTGRSSGRLTIEKVVPEDKGLSPEQVYNTYGVQPMSAGFLSSDYFFLHLLLEIGERAELVDLGDGQSEAEIKDSLVAALKRSGPGSLKTVGLFANEQAPPAPPQQSPGMPPPQGLSFRMLREVLGQTYNIKDVTLEGGRVDGDVDVLLVVNAKNLSDAEVFAMDQFMMRGGSVLVLSGKHVLDPNNMSGLGLEKVSTGLDEALQSYGVRMLDEVVMDEQSSIFPIPVTRNLGGFQVRQVQRLPYPAFVDIRPDQMDKENPAVTGLPAVVLHWATPLELMDSGEGDEDSDETKRGSALLKTTEDAWLLDNYNPNPDFDAHGELGWPVKDERGQYTLGVTFLGPFNSHFADGKAPQIEGDGALSVVKESPDRARLVVLSSASFIADPVIQLSRQTGDEIHLANLQLVQNLIDWCIEDVDLLKIRARGSYTRLLDPAGIEKRKTYEGANYVVALLSVLAIGGFTLGRRRNAKPMELLPPAGSAPRPPSSKPGPAASTLAAKEEE